MIEVFDTKLPGVKLIKPTYFEDFRGEYAEIYNKELYKSKGIDTEFIEDDISIATKGVIKGLHGNDDTIKLISCLYGKIYLVVINYNEEDSDHFGEWEAFTLSDVNKFQVLVPAKYGNGHQCVSEKSIYMYKQSHYFSHDKPQFTIRWNDERFNIFWPIKPPIVSRRDETGDIALREK